MIRVRAEPGAGHGLPRAASAMGRAREMVTQLARRIEGNAAHAKRMMNILNGCWSGRAVR